MTDAEYAEALSEISGLLARMTLEQRTEVFNGLGEYCRECGGDDLPCYCAACYDE